MAQYANAPIREAVFDIQIKETGIDPSTLKAIPKDLVARYPTVRQRKSFQGQVSLKGSNSEVNTSAESHLEGFIFSNPANNRIFQFRKNGFTFNTLKPYTNWDEFSKEAFDIWDVYKSLQKDCVIDRIALRYINRIELPMPFKAFQDYLVYMPPIPQSLPQILNRFFMQVEIPKDSNTIVVLTETVERITQKGSQYILPFLLDIDCRRTIATSINEHDLKDNFNELRAIKNDVFESSITPKGKQLFN